MTTKMTPDDPAGSSHLVPALGESWGHASTIRVILYRENSIRHALLYKSPSRQEAVVQYQVTVSLHHTVRLFCKHEHFGQIRSMQENCLKKITFVAVLTVRSAIFRRRLLSSGTALLKRENGPYQTSLMSLNSFVQFLIHF